MEKQKHKNEALLEARSRRKLYRLMLIAGIEIAMLVFIGITGLWLHVYTADIFKNAIRCGCLHAD